MLLILTPLLVSVENPFKVNGFDHPVKSSNIKDRKRLDFIETDRLSSSTLNQPDKVILNVKLSANIRKDLRNNALLIQMCVCVFCEWKLLDKTRYKIISILGNERWLAIKAESKIDHWSVHIGGIWQMQFCVDCVSYLHRAVGVDICCTCRCSCRWEIYMYAYVCATCVLGQHIQYKHIHMHNC